MDVNRTEHGEKWIFMQRLTTNLHIYSLKSANSAAFPLTTPLTPYHSPHYYLHKYTEAKNLLISQKTKSRAKVFTASPSYIWKLKLVTKFSITFPAYPWNKMQPYKKTIQILKVFVCGGGDSVLNKWNVTHATRHKTKMDLVAICSSRHVTQ